MAYVALYWFVMIIGYFFGTKQRNRAEKFKFLNSVMVACVTFLVFLMGIRMGCNEEVIKNLGTIGVQALAVTLILMAGSVAAVFVTRKLLKIDKFARDISESTKDEHRVMPQVGDNLKNGLVLESDDEQSSQGSSNLMSILIIVFVIVGLAAGYFGVRVMVSDIPKFLDISSNAMTVTLCLMLNVIGIDMGISGTVVANIKKSGLKVLAFPVAVMVGTTVAAVIISIVFHNLSMKEWLAISYGFGWYTFAPVAIANAGYVMASAVSFMHNVFRELIGIVVLPLICRKLGYIESCSLPGVASMDIGLPIVERSMGEHVIVYSFAIGLSQSFLIPILVPLAIGL